MPVIAKTVQIGMHKVKLSLKHPMKAYRWSGGITALILNLSTRRYMLILTPHTLYPEGQNPQYQLNVPHRQSVHFAKEMISCPYQDFKPKPSSPWPSH